MTFWDAVAPLYDAFEKLNKAHRRMISKICEIIPPKTTVLELAAGTGEISTAISHKSKTVLCTDISNNMLKIASRKAKKLKIDNISFKKMSIFETELQDNSVDVVIASQVLHLIDQPQKACAEIKRVTKNMAILTIPLLKEGSAFGKFLVTVYRILGFAPKQILDKASCSAFLEELGFENCECHITMGRIPLYVAVWRR